ncbi:uncharacterized protein EV422DRAFT_221645 [Fimicolochytrium jonesii]|uniref:uncharacterized protein n=1 Tax=Fimicolochytrium jonesii TaxID=1396493 RepID=UPI0022FDDFA3|nr:uncharacterized protein EV422DRAFT_221645 [Fimicolochytrium jonesii]KAI8817358.1 hypothetical protein EV422DRAFT_221645 [Fimicolochytrium jonesii]
MRFITGDEVGLTKIIAPAPPPENDQNDCPSKRRKASEKPQKDIDEPAGPRMTTTTLGTMDRGGEVQLMCWAVWKTQRDTVVVARKDGRVQYLRLEDGSVVREHVVFRERRGEDGKVVVNKYKKGEHFVGLHDVEGTLVACTDLGFVHIIPSPESNAPTSPLPSGTFTTSHALTFRARLHPQHTHLLATGGDECDLTIWNLAEQFPNTTTEETSTTPPPTQLTAHWTSRNVKNDFLNIRVPVWITELAFLDSTATRLIVGTGHHQIRIYDTTLARRPIVDITVGTHPIRSLAVYPVDNASEGVVKTVCSDTTGQMMQVNVDCKAKTAKVVGKYAGLAGAVTDVAIPAGAETVVSVGLDRLLRVFELEGGRKLVQKVYLKQRLCRVLVDDTEAETAAVGNAKGQVGATETATAGNGDEESEAEDDDVWAEISVVGGKQSATNGKAKKRKSTSKDGKSSKRKGVS